MPDGLVHVAIMVTIGCVRRRRWWVEVCESNDSVAIGEAMKDGEEGVFAARDEGDDVQSFGLGHASCRLEIVLGLWMETEMVRKDDMPTN